jgi:phosphate transport system substrate-binding protein
MTNKTDIPALLGSIVITGSLIGGLWWIFRKSDFSLDSSASIGQTNTGQTNIGQTNTSDSSPSAISLKADSRNPSETFATIQNVPLGQYSYGGSTTWAPIRLLVDGPLQAAKPEFRLRYLSPYGEAPGSGTGIRQLLARQLDFAQASRPISAKEKQQAQALGVTLKEIPVAIDGIAIAVNPSLTISGLSIEQLQEIYQGTVTNWQQVGGPDLAIVPISRGSGGTVDWFLESVLGGQAFGPNVQTIGTTTEALQKLGAEPGGIYFASAPEVVPQCTVKPVAIGRSVGQFVAPYQGTPVPKDECPANRTALNPQAFRDGTYPLTRNLYVVVRQDASAKAGEAYASLLLTGEGQGLLEKAGFVKLR